MKRLISLLCSLIFAGHLFSQEVQYKVTYDCHTKVAKGSSHNGLNTLHFNSSSGLFIHNNWPKKDSLSSDGNLYQFTKGDLEGMPVYMNIKERFIYYKSDYKATKTSFIFREDLPKIAWQIQQDSSKKIEKFNCLKALGVFGGRTYEVWFTVDIPVSLGPYKLWGLPGLILEAKSKDGAVTYQFRSYESSPADAVKIEKPKNGQEITWAAFRTFVINQLLQVEALSTDEYQITNYDPVADWEIEKNKFTIISDYRKQQQKTEKRE